MRKIMLAVVLGFVATWVLVTVALAETYVVDVVVDGKTISLSVIVDGDTLTVDTTSPGVEIASITSLPTAATQPATQPITRTVVALRNANLRSGPGTTYAVAGSVQTGQLLMTVGQNPAGDWWQLADGTWIAAFLVDDATSTNTVASTPAPLPTTSQPTAAPTLTPPPTVAPPTPAIKCDPAYPTLCIPLNSPDLDCPDIPAKNFPVLPPDPHRLDRDKDGIGCER
ncbi:MAG: excalibur calcium-binding domain-containing protein [Caldilineaceae bacterium]|nr:excalibur calcium-binding domain-containing protein [Caldilineaceae bacterium]